MFKLKISYIYICGFCYDAYRYTITHNAYVCGSICMQYRQSEYSNLFHISNSLYLSDSADVIVLCEQNNPQAVLQA